MDMYSERDMPTFTERKKSLLDYAKTLNIESDFLDSVVHQIVLETPKYSHTGYYFSGRDTERSKLRKEFNVNIKEIQDNARIIKIADSQGWDAAHKEMKGNGPMSYAEMRSRYG